MFKTTDGFAWWFVEDKPIYRFWHVHLFSVAKIAEVSYHRNFETLAATLAFFSVRV